MMPLRKKITDLLTTKPGLRTMQLCDMLDVPIDEIEEEMGDLIALNVVEKRETLAPNGRKAIAFWPVGSAQPDAATPSTEPVAPAREMTKVDKAIAFIREQPNQVATASQLHMVMGLKSTEAPSQYLTSALANGRLQKHGKNWSLGTGLKSAAVVSAPETKPDLTQIAQPNQTLFGRQESNNIQNDIPKFLEKKLTGRSLEEVTIEAPAVPKTPTQKTEAIRENSKFECGLWSESGDLELRRNGATLATLTRAEWAHLRTFANKVELV